MRETLQLGRESRHRAAAGGSAAAPSDLVVEEVGAGDSSPDGSAAPDSAVRSVDRSDVETNVGLDGEDAQVAAQRAGNPGKKESEAFDSADAKRGASGQGGPITDGDGGGDNNAAELGGLSEPTAGGRRTPAPLRERLGRETAGVAVLIVLAIVCAGLITAVVIKTRNDASQAAREAADYTPPVLATTGLDSGVPAIAVVGDESLSRGASGVAPSQRWPALLGTALDGKVDVSATDGAGYVKEGSGGSTFVEAAGEVPADADVVVIIGGAADVDADPLELAKAATRAYAAATVRAPRAAVIAVGPLFVPDGVDADDLQTVRATLQSSARIAEIRWVDPIRSKWLQHVDRTGDLTVAVERTIASRMGSVVRSEAR